MKNSIGISQLVDAARMWVWRNRHSGYESWLPVRLLKQVVRIAIAISRDLGDGQLSMRAMSLVYTTVIAVVPLIALSFSVLKGFGMHQRVEPALLDALVDLGDKRFEIVSTVMGFIDNVNIGVLGAVGFAVLIYSVISMMQKIEYAFNYTWQIRRARTMTQRFRDYLSVIFVGPLLIVLSTAITASFNTSVVLDYFVVLPFGQSIVRLVGDLLPFLLMSSSFALIYMFLPNTRVHAAAAFIGGMVTTIFWKLMGWGVSEFVANSASHIAIYSAFASIIILMVWMYMGWLVLLTGASVAYYVQHPRYLRYAKGQQVVSAEIREKLALNTLYFVARQFKQGLTPWTVNRLAVELEAPEFLIDDIVEELVQLGYLLHIAEDNNVHLARDAEDIDVGHVVRQVRASSAAGGTVVKARLEPSIEQVFSAGQAQEFSPAISLASLLGKELSQ